MLGTWSKWSSPFFISYQVIEIDSFMITFYINICNIYNAPWTDINKIIDHHRQFWHGSAQSHHITCTTGYKSTPRSEHPGQNSGAGSFAKVFSSSSLMFDPCIAICPTPILLYVLNCYILHFRSYFCIHCRCRLTFLFAVIYAHCWCLWFQMLLLCLRYHL